MGGTVYILVGPPGIGKSTLIRNNMLPDDVRVSMDDLQHMLGGGRYDNYRPELKPLYHAVEHGIITAALLGGRSVYVDRTNMDRAHRARYVTIGRLMGAAVCCWDLCGDTEPDIETLVRRRMEGARGIPEEKWREVICKMVEAYEPPDPSEGMVVERIQPLMLGLPPCSNG